MSEYNACQLSKLPKEILIKMLLAKDNTEHFDLPYCYSVRDKINFRIEKLKTEEIKRKLIEQIEKEENTEEIEQKDKKEICDFISKIIKISASDNDDLQFEYLNYKILMYYYDEIRITQDRKTIYLESQEEIHVNMLTFEFNYVSQQFYRLICKKDGICTIFENILWLLNNDKLELNLKGN